MTAPDPTPRSLLTGFAAAALLVVIGSVVCGLIVLMRDAKRRHATTQRGVALALKLTGCELTVSGLENLPESSCVVASNHQSYLDGPLLSAVLPERFVFVVKDDVERWPLAGKAVARMGGVYISRDDAKRSGSTTRQLIRYMQNGGSLTVFPEGGFTAEPVIGRFHLGAFVIATRSAVPVVPLTIIGTRRIMPAGHWLPRRGRIEVRIHPPISASGNDRAAARTLRDCVRERIVEQSDEPAIATDKDTAREGDAGRAT